MNNFYKISKFYEDGFLYCHVDNVFSKKLSWGYSEINDLMKTYSDNKTFFNYIYISNNRDFVKFFTLSDLYLLINMKYVDDFNRTWDKYRMLDYFINYDGICLLYKFNNNLLKL